MEKVMFSAWQIEMMRFAVLYRMSEGERMPLVRTGMDSEFAEPVLTELHSAGCIEIKNNEEYVLTDRGRERVKRLFMMYEAVLRFEIFGAVDLEMQLDEAISHPERGGQVRDDVYDPRFGPPDATPPGAADMRLPMLAFVSEYLQSKAPADQAVNWKEISPYRVVFLQKLASGRLKGPDFWFNLRVGEFWKQVDDIVVSHTPSASEALPPDVMSGLYTAGMLEQQKRDGLECSKCKTPLAFMPDGKCPRGCQEQAGSRSAETYACPLCSRKLRGARRKCVCGARVDWSLAPGEISETTTETRVFETRWEPAVYYGYYDPFDPWTDALVLSVLLEVW